MLRRLLAMAIVAIVIVGSSVTGASASDHRTPVCHQRGNGDYHLIEIDEHALDAHLGHGDARPGTTLPGTASSLGNDCAIEEAHPAIVASLTGSGVTRTSEGIVTLILDAYALSDGTVVGTYYAQVDAGDPVSGPVTAFVWEDARAEVCGTTFALGIDTIADLSIDDPSIVDCTDGTVHAGPYSADPAGLEGGVDFVLNVYL